jgi:hypothetical protein
MFRRIIVALVSVFALALTASVPAQAATGYTTNITAQATPDTVAKGKSVVLKGKLTYKRDGKWRVLSGRELIVRFDPAGPLASKKIAKIKTTRTGTYSFRTTATKSGTWTVSFGGKKGSLRSDSARDNACVYTAGRWQCPITPSNPDLDCSDVGKTVWVGTKDYHRLDADDDGWGCDSYS